MQVGCGANAEWEITLPAEVRGERGRGVFLAMGARARAAGFGYLLFETH
jgi:hypothetical protein